MKEGLVGYYEDAAVEKMLCEAGLPRSFDEFPLYRSFDKPWQVLELGNYDGLSGGGGESAAVEYYRTATEKDALPLNHWVEWPGMMEAIMVELGDKERPTVFEIGGGNGRQMAEIIERFRPSRTVFVEYSREMLRMASERLGGETEFILASAEDGLLALEDGKFDLGVASLVMHYLSPEQLARFYLRLEKVLADDGSFLFTGPTDEFYSFIVPNVSKDCLRNITWVMYDSERQPKWEMRANVYHPEDHVRLAAAVGLEVSVRVLEPKVPPGFGPENVPIWDLLHSPVWNLYKVEKK